MNIIQLFFAQVTGAAALFSGWLAYSYMYEGFGLHPFASIPAAVVFLLAPYVVRRLSEGEQ